MNAPEVLNRPQLTKLTVRDFLILNDAGVFANNARSELIEGDIWIVNALYSRHARVQTILLRLLADACDALGHGIEAWVDGSVALSDDSMPQPDILIVRTPIDGGPVPADRLLVAIEVSDTSLDHDLGRKATLYAENGIAEYWVVDVDGRMIHQMWSAVAGNYAEHRSVAFGGMITAATIADLRIETTRL